jgi:hypothetical protein
MEVVSLHRTGVVEATLTRALLRLLKDTSSTTVKHRSSTTAAAAASTTPEAVAVADVGEDASIPGWSIHGLGSRPTPNSSSSLHLHRGSRDRGANQAF